MRKTHMALLAVVAAFVLFFLWASYPWELGSKVESQDFSPEPSNADLSRPTTLTVLTWNMAYGYGDESEGTSGYVLKSKESFEKNLETIAQTINHSNADVVFLQEIDFRASRSHRIDQLEELAKLTGLTYWARAVSWCNQYVPFPYWPISRQFGKISSGGAILSRWPITKNEVHLLAKPPSKAWWYNLFYPYRYFQFVKINVGGEVLRVGNLHLEAFDAKNREEQAGLIKELAQKRKIDLIAGDFNTLPMGALKQSGFSNPDDNYEGDGTPAVLKTLPYEEVFAAGGPAQREENWLTFPASRPDRRLDYIYFRPKWAMISAEVVTGPHQSASDHLPVKATFKFLTPEFIRD